MDAEVTLAGLRRRIEGLEAAEPGHRPAELASRSGLSLGDPEVDDHLSGGLAWGTHQIAGGVADGGAGRAFTAFLLARWLAHRSDTQVLVIQEASALREGGEVYAPGFHALGVDPGRLILVQAKDGGEVLRLLNEALRARTPKVVVGDLWDGAALADLSITRRFNLAAGKARMLAFLTTPDLSATSAALTRWRVASAPSSAPRRRLGAPALAVELVRNRHGRTGRWTLEWSSHELSFRSLDAPRRRQGDAGDPAALAASVVSKAGHRSDQALERPVVRPFGAYRQAG